MKEIVKTLLITAFLIVAPALIFAQQPPHPNGGIAPVTGAGGNTPVGAGAPIDSGTILLIGLAGLYGGRKIYGIHKSLEG